MPRKPRGQDLLREADPARRGGDEGGGHGDQPQDVLPLHPPRLPPPPGDRGQDQDHQLPDTQRPPEPSRCPHRGGHRGRQGEL